MFLLHETGKDLRFANKKGRELANLRLVQECDIDRLRQLGAINRTLFCLIVWNITAENSEESLRW